MNNELTEKLLNTDSVCDSYPLNLPYNQHTCINSNKNSILENNKKVVCYNGISLKTQRKITICIIVTIFVILFIISVKF